ncbi:MAG: hypothetical protein AB7N29_23790 [Vicinamibacterales bacterium]
MLGPGSSTVNGTVANGGEHYQAPWDDFTQATSGMIRAVEWQGYYCNRAFTGSAIPDPSASSFYVRLAPNDPSLLHPHWDALRAASTSGAYQVSVIPASAVVQQFEFSRLDAPCGARNGGDPAAHYNMSANLPVPYPVTAGTKYWISIHAVIVTGAQVSWHWRFGRPDNNSSIYWLYNSPNSGTMTHFPNERAVALWDR